MEEFGKLIGKSKAYISMLKKNKNSRSGNPITPSMDTFKAVANVLNITINNLLQSLDNNQPININKTSSPTPKEIYYTDPAVAKYTKAFQTNTNIKLLFDATKDMSKEDINYVVDLVERLKGNKGKQK